MRKLVLLHGAPGDGTLWQPVESALGDNVSVVAPTLRWFGREPWDADAGEFGTDAHTDQLIALLEGCGSGNALPVAAWSYSTHVVLNALSRRPELISKAFLYEPGLSTYLTDTDDMAAFNADAGIAFGPIVAALHSGGPERAVEALFDSSGGEGCFAALSAPRRDAYLASARIMPLLMGGGQQPANITADVLAQIKVPVLVAHGRQTRPLFRIASRAVARNIPGAQLNIVEDADHMLPEKDPRRFASLLDAWLSS